MPLILSRTRSIPVFQRKRVRDWYEMLGRGYKPRPEEENMKGGLMVGNHGIETPKSCMTLCVRQIYPDPMIAYFLLYHLSL